MWGVSDVFNLLEHWNKYPEDGWERKVLVKMFNNKSGTQVFRERSLRTRLPYAYQECGGYKL